MILGPISVGRHTLPNGLRLVHSYDPTTAMVAVDVLYNVGARDEKRSLTGIAHLFEHLMFAGSANIPDFDGELEAAGGRILFGDLNDPKSDVCKALASNYSIRRKPNLGTQPGVYYLI